MSDPEPQTNGEPSPHIEKLLDAANTASQTVAALHVAFMAFAAYLGVIVWGTTHEDLLRISPVKLPILDVELPLTTFYSFVPWLLVLLHFNLLMQLELLSRKLWNLDRDLPATPAGQQVRDRLFIFPFTHLIAGRANVSLINWLLSLSVGITVIALPLFMLLAAQIRFLPFHDEVITWSQRVAVWGDVLIILILWPLIASLNDSAWEWRRNLGFRLFGNWFAWLRYWGIIFWNRLARWIQHRWPRLRSLLISSWDIPRSGAEAKGMIVLLVPVFVVFPLSIVGVIPGSITLQIYYDPTLEVSKDNTRYFEDWLILAVPKTWFSVVTESTYYAPQICVPEEGALGAKKSSQIMLDFTCEWFDLGPFPRNLSLKETRLIPLEVSLALLNRAINPEKTVHDAAFKEFEGLKLKKRDLRFADLSDAVLPKADLWEAQMQGVDLSRTNLQGAHLSGAKLQGSRLAEASLQDADMGEANLQNAHLNDTHLESADLGKANLLGAVLVGADLHGAHLSLANLKGVNLSQVNLQGANLVEAYLQGSNLFAANLQGANMSGALMRAAILTYAELQGTLLEETHLQDAHLGRANLQGADLVRADLQGADLSGADLKNASLVLANLRGINWSESYLDGLFIAGSTSSKGSDNQQQNLEAKLKPLLGEPASRTGCYSDNPVLLECQYRLPAQLDTYRSRLHPKLIKLACSNRAITEGIVRRSLYGQTNSPAFGLASALLKVLDTPKPCKGLAALSEQTRRELRKTLEHQKKEAKPK